MTGGLTLGGLCCESQVSNCSHFYLIFWFWIKACRPRKAFEVATGAEVNISAVRNTHFLNLLAVSLIDWYQNPDRSLTSQDHLTQSSSGENQVQDIEYICHYYYDKSHYRYRLNLCLAVQFGYRARYRRRPVFRKQIIAQGPELGKIMQSYSPEI